MAVSGVEGGTGDGVTMAQSQGKRTITASSTYSKVGTRGGGSPAPPSTVRTTTTNSTAPKMGSGDSGSGIEANSAIALSFVEDILAPGAMRRI